MNEEPVIVPLTQGKVALIDACFAGPVLALKWYAQKGGRTYYADRMYTPKKGARRKVVSLHQFIAELAGIPVSDGQQVDHINGDGLDNRLGNLRVVTLRQNAINRHYHRTGKLAGTSFHKKLGKWGAFITINGQSVALGVFKTEAEAHAVYCQALWEHAPEEAAVICPGKQNWDNLAKQARIAAATISPELRAIRSAAGKKGAQALWGTAPKGENLG
jgi:hypothetical protein